MWTKLKRKVKNIFKKLIKTRNEVVLEDSDNKDRDVENDSSNGLSFPTTNDMELQIDGNWLSKALIDATFADTPEEKLLKISGQTDINRLEDIITKKVLNRMEVLWSGCYSEVLRVKPLIAAEEDIVLKVSLINRMNKNGVVTQNSSSVLSDIINSKRLSDLKAIGVQSANNYCENFANITNFYYIRSHRLVFNKSETNSKNDRIKSFDYFVSQQTFGGIELNSVSGLSALKGLSLGLQLVAAMAVAEEAMEFEHRDLHSSNILIKKSEQKYANYVINGQKFCLKLNGIKAIIIDTTFSRTQIKIHMNGDKQLIKSFYNDLSSLNLDDYPRGELKDVYLRQKAITGNKWNQFWPKTNIIWLSYCLNRICKKVDNWSKKHSIDTNSSDHYCRLFQIKDNISAFDSVKSFAKFCQFFE